MTEQEDVHECEFYKGIIKDVASRNNDREFFCRRCGKQLPLKHVHQSVLDKCKDKNNLRR